MKNKIIILISILSILCSGCASSGKVDVLKDTSDSAINTIVTEEVVSESTVEEVSVAELATTEEPTTEVVSTEKTESNAPFPEVIKISLSEDGEVIEIETDASADDSISDDDEYLALEQSDVPSRTVHNESYFDYEYGTAFNGYGVYELDDDITRGAVATSNLAENSPTILDFEAYYGLTAYTADYNIYVKAYNHSKDHPIIASEIISDIGDTMAIEVTYEDYIMIDCSDFEEGLYAIHTTFDTMDMYLYFYVAENGVFTCRVNNNPAYETELLMFRMDDLRTAIKNAGVTPENSLSIDNIVYPCIESVGHRCDTERWAQLSHDLLNGHYEWSDETKLFVYTEWFINNIKYDDYRHYTLCQSRAMKYGVWDGTYSMWDLKVGVCCDFTDALIIMLREQGIPATSIENQEHMWLAVYIDDIWREIDITTIMPFHSYDEDAADCVNFKTDYKDYGSYTKNDTILTIGAEIWTYNRAMYGHQ